MEVLSMQVRNSDRYRVWTKMPMTRILVAFHGILVFLLITFGHSLAQQEKTLSASVEDLASQIGGYIEKEQKKKIAIVPFSDLNGQVNVLGKYLAEELTTQLFKTGKLEIIERNLLDKVFQELKLGETGAIDAVTAKKLGKIAGVDAIVTGTLTDIGPLIGINCRLIDAQSGKIIAVASTKLIKDDAVIKIMSQVLQAPAQDPSAKDKVRSQSNGSVRGWLGLSGRKVTPEDSKSVDANMLHGYLVTRVNKDGPAHKAGLRPGDVIVAFNGKIVQDPDHLKNMVNQSPVSLEVEVRFIRHRIERNVMIAVAKHPFDEITELDKVLFPNPRDANAYLNRGIAYMRVNDDDRALSDLSQALALNPNEATAYLFRGGIYGRKKLYDLAISDLSRAIAINPNDADAFVSRGICYSKKGKLDHAIMDYNQALVVDPNHQNAYFNRGIAYAKKSQHDLAISDYSRAIAINPSKDYAYFNRAVSYFHKGHHDLFTRDLQKACNMGNKSGCMELQKFMEWKSKQR